MPEWQARALHLRYLLLEAMSHDMVGAGLVLVGVACGLYAFVGDLFRRN